MLIQDNRIPLYQQLKESIRSSLLNNEWQTGEKIPTEMELSKKYDISRVTVRKAILELVKEGYLVKKQGKGTFVSLPKIERKIVHFLSFTAACEANGIKTYSKVIKKEIIEPDADMKLRLQLQSDDMVIYIQRVRIAGETPLMLENNYFSYQNYKFLLKEKLDRSLYEVLRDSYQINPCNPGETSLEIVRATDTESTLLEVINGEPLFLMRTVINDKKNIPVHTGKQYIVGEGYKFILS